MSELKAVHAFDVYEAYTKTGDDDAAQVYLKSEADKVIADLIEKNKRLARKDLIMASETIKDLEESHKKEVDRLLMKIAGLEKLVETADKLLKQKGGFKIKDITFDGVKLEWVKNEP